MGSGRVCTVQYLDDPVLVGNGVDVGELAGYAVHKRVAKLLLGIVVRLGWILVGQQRGRSLV
jgi:hypothetical protein